MKNMDVVGLLFELLDSSDEALDYICENLNNNNTESCIKIFESLKELYENIAKYVKENDIKEKHRGWEAAMNAALTAGKLRDICINEDHENASLRMVYELIPLNVFLRNELHFWFLLFPETEKMQGNRDTILKSVLEYIPQHELSLKMEYTYDVSIMLLCYNKAYLSKIAYRSLLKYTDFEKYNVEIIVVNNGSDDKGETSEFIQSINDPGVKTVDLKYPLGYNGYSLGPVAAQGRYFVEFHSDVVATENWLDNLMKCITSDPFIGAVVSVCNESTNGQSINVDYSNPMDDDSEMQQFAAKYNFHDPSKWEYRARLLPTSGYVIPTMLYRLISRDPWLYFGQFADDDMSMYLRRCGFKQIVAKDTFLHHFGSQTSGNEIVASNSLELSRKRFYEKWGVDAWYGMLLIPTVLNYIESQGYEDNKSFLLIDPLFGANWMYIFNELRKNGKKEGKVTAVVSDLRYLEDTNVYFDTVFSGNVYDSLCKINKSQKKQNEGFDYIIFHQDISEYIDRDFPKLLKALHTICKRDSKIIFTLKNASYYQSLSELANGAVVSKSYEPWSGVRFMDPNYLIATINECDFSCSIGHENCINVKENAKLLKQVQSLAIDDEKAKDMAVVSRLFVINPKPGFVSESTKPIQSKIENIAVVGTNQYGEELIRRTKKAPESLEYRIVCFCDSTGQYTHETLHGFPNVNMDLLVELYHKKEIDKIVVAFSGYSHAPATSTVFKQLQNAGIKDRVFILPPWFFDGIYDYVQNTLQPFVDSEVVSLSSALIRADMNKAVLDYVSPFTNLHCNFKCKACSVASPLVEPNFIPVSSFKKDIDRLKEFFWHISRMRLTGGESLLHPDIAEMVQIVRDVYPGTGLAVQTNGLLLLKDDGKFDELFKVMRDCHCGFQISTYKPITDKKDKIAKLLKKHDIQWHWAQMSGKPVEEFESFRMLKPENDMVHQHSECYQTKYCHALINGYMYPCGSAISSEAIEKFFNVKFEELDENIDKMRINLHDTKLGGWDIIEFLKNPTPLCKYCCYERRQVMKWEQFSTDKSRLEDFVLV